MKSMLYVGAVLMTGACIYGFADYRKVSHNKEFKSLYHQEATSHKSRPSPQQVNDAEPIEKVNLKSTVEPASAKELTSIVKTVFKGSSMKKVSHRKRLNYKLYSRAALEVPEKIISPEEIEKVEKVGKK